MRRSSSPSASSAEEIGEGLAKWCEEVAQVPAYIGFMRELRQDYAAVEQALCPDQTEEQMNRLKMIKRQGYRRATGRF